MSPWPLRAALLLAAGLGYGAAWWTHRAPSPPPSDAVRADQFHVREALGRIEMVLAAQPSQNGLRGNMEETPKAALAAAKVNIDGGSRTVWTLWSPHPTKAVVIETISIDGTGEIIAGYGKDCSFQPTVLMTSDAGPFFWDLRGTVFGDLRIAKGQGVCARGTTGWVSVRLLK